MPTPTGPPPPGGGREPTRRPGTTGGRWPRRRWPGRRSPLGGLPTLGLLAGGLLAGGLLAGGLLTAAGSSPAYAAGGAAVSLQGLISHLTTWLVGILAALATLFLTVGGLRYLTAGGDPGQVEKAKTALKSAAVGYALAALAPLIVTILTSLFGGG